MVGGDDDDRQVVDDAVQLLHDLVVLQHVRDGLLKSASVTVILNAGADGSMRGARMRKVDSNQSNLSLRARAARA